MTLLVPEGQIDAVEKDITEQTAGKAQMEQGRKGCLRYVWERNCIFRKEGLR